MYSQRVGDFLFSARTDVMVVLMLNEYKFTFGIPAGRVLSVSVQLTARREKTVSGATRAACYTPVSTD